MESIIQSPGVQALIRHFREEGRQQGREEGREEAREEAREEGREEGRKEVARSALLRVMTRRGFAITDEIRQRVEAERDLARLRAWLDAAVTATSIADIFG